MKYPFDDENMIFDEEVDRYVLTKKCAENLGINLLARIRLKGAANPELVLKNTLRQVSLMIYRYLNAHALDTKVQDYYLKYLPGARPVLQEAMEQQLLYYLQVGNLSRSTDIDKRALSIDEMAKLTLDKRIPELGHALTLTGRWNRVRHLGY